LSNTSLSKSQRHEKSLKAVFGKHVLKTKKMNFPMLKFEHAKHVLKVVLGLV
jgi:hypothetical protein